MLGLIQGLTEFLPISSSGHLVIFHRLLETGKPDLLFDTSLHVGTLLAVAVVLRRDLWEILSESIQAVRDMKKGASLGACLRSHAHFRILFLIAAASVPTALIGIGLKDTFESLFDSLPAVGIALCVTGILLLLTALTGEGKRDALRIGLGTALLIGVAQAAAITPGVSRSGATICTALYLGMDRDLAGRFSFLIAIPAILGAELVSLAGAGGAASAPLVPLAIGTLTAAVVGYAALKILLSVVRKGRVYYFAPYCIVLGIVVVLTSIF